MSKFTDECWDTLNRFIEVNARNEHGCSPEESAEEAEASARVTEFFEELERYRRNYNTLFSSLEKLLEEEKKHR